MSKKTFLDADIKWPNHWFFLPRDCLYLDAITLRTLRGFVEKNLEPRLSDGYFVYFSVVRKKQAFTLSKQQTLSPLESQLIAKLLMKSDAASCFSSSSDSLAPFPNHDPNNFKMGGTMSDIIETSEKNKHEIMQDKS